MKLDYDLIREIMLTIEEMEHGQHLDMTTYKQYPRLTGRGYHEIEYNIYRMIEAGYIPLDSVDKTTVRKVHTFKYVSVSALTWDGHQFLNHIRDKNILEKVREKIPNIDTLPVGILLEAVRVYLRKFAESITP